MFKKEKKESEFSWKFFREENKHSNSRFDSFVKFFKIPESKRSQLTVFIILAILIIVGVVIFFVIRGNGVSNEVPKDFLPVYTYYLSCIQDETHQGALILGEHGGYINLPQFYSGSSYMPFSSQLNFLGTGVPYWYYISGNGVTREQKPSLEKMQSELNDYLKERISKCDFSSFKDAGYNVFIGEPRASTTIQDSSILIDVGQDLTIVYGDQSWSATTHSTSVNSNLGKFYKISDKIYSKQKSDMFLENYGVDILRLYAPVDGSEISCSSKIWQVDKVRENLMNALEANIPAIKIKGNYYNLAVPENKYFVVDVGENTEINVNFMYSRYWPMKLEVWPSDEGILKADPVGTQEGLGMLGFCYVPYHFVYDFSYPVMIQLFSGNEIFQFPVVVSIDKNMPRQALNAQGMPDVVPELCEHKNSSMTVYTYDNYLNPIVTDIKFKCFDTTCDVGKTVIKGTDAIFIGNFPQCVNGYIIASAQGYETEKYLVTGLSENTVNIAMKKKYKLNLEVDKSGTKTDDYAVLSFIGNKSTMSISYPEQKEVELAEGPYLIKLVIYSNSSINLKGSSTEKCVDVAKNGVLGILGMTESKCFTMTVPDQTIGYAVSGGGTQNWYFGESELAESNKIIVDGNNFGVPTKLEDLQTNYNNIDISRLNIRLEKS